MMPVDRFVYHCAIVSLPPGLQPDSFGWAHGIGKCGRRCRRRNKVPCRAQAFDVRANDLKPRVLRFLTRFYHSVTGPQPDLRGIAACIKGKARLCRRRRPAHQACRHPAASRMQLILSQSTTRSRPNAAQGGQRLRPLLVMPVWPAARKTPAFYPDRLTISS